MLLKGVAVPAGESPAPNATGTANNLADDLVERGTVLISFLGRVD